MIPKASEAKECRTVFINGCFDLLHEGHLALLRFGRDLKGKHGRLVVAVNTDESVRRLKGAERPLQTWEVRCEAIRKTSFADEVVAAEDDPMATITLYWPDIVIKGSGYSRCNLPELQEIERYGGQVIFLPRNECPDISTSKIIAHGAGLSRDCPSSCRSQSQHQLDRKVRSISP